MKILKFGGSSIAENDRMLNVARIIQDCMRKGEKVVVVVSALGGITDQLIQMSKLAERGDLTYKSILKDVGQKHFAVVKYLISAKKYTPVMEKLINAQEELGNLLHGVCLLKELTPRSLDYILSFGERNSAYILSQALQQMKLDADFVDAREIIITDSHFGNAKVDFDATNQLIRNRFKDLKKIPVVTGFIGQTTKGITTTLGRGGSDYTASILGAALDANEIQIWTDVSGVMTADPRKVPKAFPIPRMTYKEAMEMSHFGAKVIYPPTIIPALEKSIPIRIKSSLDPNESGTFISEDREDNGGALRGISTIDNVALITLQGSGLIGMVGCAARLFNTIARNGINIILITQGSSEHSISFAVRPSEAELAAEVLSKEFELEMKAKLIDPVLVESDLSILAVIGENMKSRPGISAQLFQALGRNGINVVVTSQGSSERNISVAIQNSDVTKALNVVHEAFFLSGSHSLNLFIIGVGQVGSTLLDQINANRAHLKKRLQIDIRVVALGNSKKMYFDPAGLDLNTWERSLENEGEEMDGKAFMKKMASLNLPNSVFVDNTASKDVADLYLDILQSSISISTPNKIAPSAAYEHYSNLKKIAERRKVKFAYETNVGAGLPVITSLSDLMASGDRILKIEGILSGSISFIFNSFKAGKKFSEIVNEARDRGYTEPDPRLDLNGTDVARKLLILARESGMQLELENIVIENILPKACQEAPDIPSFFEALKANDEHFEHLRKEAEEGKQLLRYIATLEGEKAFISLQRVESDSPFANLSGTDNMIVFQTDRYKDQPLIIKGPGAGAEVTAAGVFAEIIRIGNYLSY